MNQDELQNTVLCGDALEMLKTLPDEYVQMCVTSPPYYGLRDYGAEGQIGCEQTPLEYIDRLTEIFREVRRVLKSNGTLWLNIADSYAGSGKGVWSKSLAERPKSKQTYHSLNTDENAALPKKWDGIKEKDMIGIPWQLAFALRADGWYLRSDIIWQKPNCLPEAVKDRPTKSYEHIFLLSKSPHYYYDTAAISEPVAPVTVERNKRAVSDRTKYAKGVGGAKPQALFLPRSHSDMPTKRNKRDVWSVSTNSHRGYGHFAMYPERLIEPCILAGSPEQGLVLDPFFGSGTTGAVCKRLSRRYLGIELNPEYCETAKTRIQQTKEELYLGSKNQPRNTQLHGSDVLWTVPQTVHFFCPCLRHCGGRVFPAQAPFRHGNGIVDVHFSRRTLCGAGFY